MAKTPFLDAIDLVTILADGGYNQHIKMTQATNLLLLSGIHVLNMRWLWESAIQPVDDTLWHLIEEALQEAEAQLMTNFAIGSLFPSVAVMIDPDVILLIGQTIPQVDYPELTAVVPATWLVGADIQLPDMRSVSVQGAMDLSDFGTLEGSNEHTLTVDEMPSHTHIQDPHSHTFTTPIVTPDLSGLEPVPSTTTTPTPSVTGSTIAINQNTGNDQPHNNVPLSLQVAWYIVAR